MLIIPTKLMNLQIKQDSDKRLLRAHLPPNELPVLNEIGFFTVQQQTVFCVCSFGSIRYLSVLIR
jgi:hypothetical protein